ncbi:hypothetical protein Tco_0692618 [Tanacetum coccineum]
MKVKQSINVIFDENHTPPKTLPFEDDELVEEETIRVSEKTSLGNVVEDETLEVDEIVNVKEYNSYPLENIIGNLNQRTLRSQPQNKSNFFCFISTIEPKNVGEALKDESRVVAIQEELNQFTTNDVWELVPQPKSLTFIGTKWVFRNKLDENGIVSRNKARLVAQEMLKKFSLEDSKPMKMPMSLDTKLTKDEEGESVDNTKYKGVIVGYVSAKKACQQALWMKQALIDYDIHLDEISIIKKADAEPTPLAYDPRDVETIERLQQQIQELELQQPRPNLPAEEAETEPNVWDKESVDVNPFGRGKHRYVNHLYQPRRNDHAVDHDDRYRDDPIRSLGLKDRDP